MSNLWFGLVLIIGMAYCSVPVANTTPVILVLGDSLSSAYGMDQQQGWVSLLQQDLQHRNINYTVVNSSISGDTTLNALNRLQPVLNRHKPHIVIIELGGNDGLRGLSITEMNKLLLLSILNE